MERKLLKFARILIYLIYAYVFVWQIYYFNQEIFYRDELHNTKSTFLWYMPAIIILSYGVLIYGDIVLRQRKVSVFNSLFAASILYMYTSITAIIIATLLSIFALLIAGLELRDAR